MINQLDKSYINNLLKTDIELFTVVESNFD